MNRRVETTITLSFLNWDNMGPKQWAKVKDIIWTIVDADIVDLGDGCIDIVFKQDATIIDIPPSLYDPGEQSVQCTPFTEDIVEVLEKSGFKTSVLFKNKKISA